MADRRRWTPMAISPRQRPVARVRQPAAGPFEGRRQIAAPRVDTAQHVVRGPPGWGAHGETGSKRWPGDQR